ncbi:MAG: hypothetical protein AAFW83_14680 [Pseudomonadota bacterium]
MRKAESSMPAPSFFVDQYPVKIDRQEEVKQGEWPVFHSRSSILYRSELSGFSFCQVGLVASGESVTYDYSAYVNDTEILGIKDGTTGAMRRSNMLFDRDGYFFHSGW